MLGIHEVLCDISGNSLEGSVCVFFPFFHLAAWNTGVMTGAPKLIMGQEFKGCRNKPMHLWSINL